MLFRFDRTVYEIAWDAKKSGCVPGAIFFSKDLRNRTRGEEGEGKKCPLFDERSFCIVMGSSMIRLHADWPR